jgi:hypothetical protein
VDKTVDIAVDKFVDFFAGIVATRRPQMFAMSGNTSLTWDPPG